VPIICIAFLNFLTSIIGGIRDVQVAYAQSAGYAEQALQAIKIVQTYGQEKLEARLYVKHLKKVYE